MTEVLQTNIFFFIASAAVIAFTILLCVAIFYVIVILRSISQITKRINEGSEHIASDVSRFKSYVLEGGFISQIVGLFARSGRSKKRRQQSDD
ncbi:MAG: hypothetical protein WDZ56_01710 [Candidatus Paceibacterota bacterium]